MFEASNDSMSELKFFVLANKHNFCVIMHVFFPSSSATDVFGMEQMGNFERAADEEENAWFFTWTEKT